MVDSATKILNKSIAATKAEEKTAKTQIKLVKAQEKLKKTKPAEIKTPALYKKLSKPLVAKSIVKQSKITIHVKQKPVESVWDAENRFFKGEMNREKRSLFFS